MCHACKFQGCVCAAVLQSGKVDTRQTAEEK